MMMPDPLTTTPNEAEAILTINAIYQWVSEQRPLTDTYPLALPLINDFDTWYGALEQRFDQETIFTLNRIGVAESNEAKRRRDAIQAVTHNQLPDDSMGTKAPPGIPPEVPGVGDLVVKGGILAVIAGVIYKWFKK